MYLRAVATSTTKRTSELGARRRTFEAPLYLPDPRLRGRLEAEARERIAHDVRTLGLVPLVDSATIEWVDATNGRIRIQAVGDDE